MPSSHAQPALEESRIRPAHPGALDGEPEDEAGLNLVAARTLRLIGWLSALGAMLTALALVLPSPPTSSAEVSLALWLLLACAGMLGAALFGVARGLGGGRRWARLAGIGCGALALIGFPAGTVVGCLVLRRLLFDWQPAPPGR